MVFEDKDIAQIDATIIVGVLILLSVTNINPNIPFHFRVSEAFAIAFEMILPFAISAVLALAGRIKVSRYFTAAGFVILVVLLLGAWLETEPKHIL
ncbi:MAG TPA: hypothetical protein VH500_25410 [Nitrososphaeraceae archaeon]|jgi:hypothetical protein